MIRALGLNAHAEGTLLLFMYYCYLLVYKLCSWRCRGRIQRVFPIHSQCVCVAPPTPLLLYLPSPFCHPRNHMTQLRCLNWDAPQPVFEEVPPPLGGVYTPTFEKLSEGFTAIRMVEGGREGECGACCSAPTIKTPSHPYAWDTPLFTWADDTDEVRLSEP